MYIINISLSHANYHSVFSIIGVLPLVARPYLHLTGARPASCHPPRSPCRRRPSVWRRVRGPPRRYPPFHYVSHTLPTVLLCLFSAPAFCGVRKSPPVSHVDPAVPPFLLRSRPGPAAGHACKSKSPCPSLSSPLPFPAAMTAALRLSSSSRACCCPMSRTAARY